MYNNVQSLSSQAPLFLYHLSFRGAARSSLEVATGRWQYRPLNERVVCCVGVVAG
jgi:hypothetical protein